MRGLEAFWQGLVFFWLGGLLHGFLFLLFIYSTVVGWFGVFFVSFSLIKKKNSECIIIVMELGLLLQQLRILLKLRFTG